MPRFAANLTLMYPELPFVDRFAAAAVDGFLAVECLFPYTADRADLAQRLRDHGLKQVLINAPPGDWNAGERGLALRPQHRNHFRQAFVEQALPYASTLGCTRIHVMAGLVPEGADHAELRTNYLENLAWAARQAAYEGIDVLIEPLNARDMPGYFLNRQEDAHAIVQAIGAPNLKVQLDLYHCQISEGDLSTRISKDLPSGRVGHIQIAGVPHRHEPDTGEIHYPHLFALIDELGYDGHVGCEYRPRAGTSAGLGWLQPYLAASAGTANA
jgi:hydroxypyruvate isomerase